MDSVLIVSNREKSVASLMELLSQNAYKEILTVANGGEARRLLIEREVDLCVIDSPLPDEFGESLARSVMSDSAGQVILLVKSELYEEVSAKVEELGVFTIARPLSRSLLWSVLKLADAAYHNMRRMRKENRKLAQKIDDIRIVSRAKCILIEYLRMSEADAHRYIEKQAMDMRISRKEVAEGILKTYE